MWLDIRIMNMHMMDDYVTCTLGKIYENFFSEILQI